LVVFVLITDSYLLPICDKCSFNRPDELEQDLLSLLIDNLYTDTDKKVKEGDEKREKKN
jgi:hypothetical protein